MSERTENSERAGNSLEWSWWYLLFVVQAVAVLWPPFFNRTDPALGGLPFFYWYQLLWVIIGAILTAVVYVATRDRSGAARRPPRRSSTG